MSFRADDFPATRAEYYVEGEGIPKLVPKFVPGNRSIAYTKKVWRELGGLPEDLTLYADDSVFGMQMIQAGYKMAQASHALVYWSRPARLRDFWKEMYNYGKGTVSIMPGAPQEGWNLRP